MRRNHFRFLSLFSFKEPNEELKIKTLTLKTFLRLIVTFFNLLAVKCSFSLLIKLLKRKVILVPTALEFRVWNFVKEGYILTFTIFLYPKTLFFSMTIVSKKPWFQDRKALLLGMAVEFMNTCVLCMINFFEISF